MLAKIAAAKKRWMQVKGPISLVIVSLLEIGWAPALYDTWGDPEGESWKLDPSADVKELLGTMQKQAMQKTWAEAALHHEGRGLQNGVDIFPSLTSSASGVRQKREKM